MVIKLFLATFHYISHRKAKLVATLEVVTTTEYLEMLYLNSCETCTKFSGITGIRLRLHYKVFKKPKVLVISSLEALKAPWQPVGMSLLRKSEIDFSNKLPYISAN